MIPQLKWKLWVRGAEATDEMILERLNCTFGGVDVVVVWLDKLNRAIL